jgi:membrane peptidoglycan carboxypeptidase
VNPFYFPGFDVAAKTGTTNDFRDVWTVGYTPSIVVGTWAGNNNNSPMVKEIAGYIIAPMWNQFMQVALQKYPKEYFGPPRAIPDNAPPALRGQYMDASGPHDILYLVDKNNPLGGGSSRGDAQNAYWEYPIGSWGASYVAPQQTGMFPATSTQFIVPGGDGTSSSTVITVPIQ